MISQNLILGIVGKIGTGKSTVARIFSEQYGFHRIDVDQLGHQALDAKKSELVEIFGPDILSKDGKVERAILGNIVFSDIHKLHQLNNLVHPRMRQEVRNLISRGDHQRYLIDAALLFEMGLDEYCNFILTIDAPKTDIVKRVTQNRGWTEDKILKVLKTQHYLDLLKDRSHFIIFNNGTLEKLLKQIEFFILEIT